MEADRSDGSAEDLGSVVAEVSVAVVAKDADGSDGKPNGQLMSLVLRSEAPLRKVASVTQRRKEIYYATR